RTICNLYGVSSVLFNDNEQSTYNNVEQARKDFYEYTIKPLNSDFSEKFTKFLGDENVRLEFDYTNVEVLQDALYTKAQALNSMEFLDDNEKREIIGFDKRKEPLNDKNINNTDGNR
ncbi:MAG: phage portal protein, partial [Nanoarchaeota archaeon]|nr:phage portal protein [Nanoarchaeota archaeon]